MGVNGVFGEWRELRFGNPGSGFTTGGTGAHGGVLFCGGGCGAFGNLVGHSPSLDCENFSVKVVRHIGGGGGCGKVLRRGVKAPPKVGKSATAGCAPDGVPQRLKPKPF